MDQQRKAFIEKEFSSRYHAEPQIWARAPGRVDLMGSHTDYNMGYVMTMTIDRDTWIAARPRADHQVRIASANVAGESCFDLEGEISRDKEAPWSNYIRGVARAIQEAGYELQGFDGFVHSTVPFGSGLSSSAALEMATAIILQKVSGFELDPVEMALLGQKAENEFVGVNTGILDQYSSAMGKADNALLLDCRDLSSEDVPIAGGLQIVICDTRAERNLAGSEYDDRRAQCEEGVRFLQQFKPRIKALRDVPMPLFEAHEADMPALAAKRCRFIIEENQRVLDLAEALPAGDPQTLADLFSSSYAGARDLFEIGAPAMEAMMQAMHSGPGIVAARQAGAGFGGCMVALVEDGALEDFTAHVRRAYTEDTGLEPNIYKVAATAGAEMFNFAV